MKHTETVSKTTTDTTDTLTVVPTTGTYTSSDSSPSLSTLLDTLSSCISSIGTSYADLSSTLTTDLSRVISKTIPCTETETISNPEEEDLYKRLTPLYSGPSILHNKEFHIFLDNMIVTYALDHTLEYSSFSNLLSKHKPILYSTIGETTRAILRHDPVIYTTQLSFLSVSTLQRGYTIYLHYIDHGGEGVLSLHFGSNRLPPLNDEEHSRFYEITTDTKIYQDFLEGKLGNLFA